MTVYTAIPNADIDQDSPVTQPLLTALRDNVLAIAEVDSSVPLTWKIGTVPLGTINTTSGSSQTLSSLDLTPYRLLFCNFTNVQFTTGVGGGTITFLGVPSLTPGSTSGTIRGHVLLELASGIGFSNLANITAAAPTSATPTSLLLRTTTTNASTSVTVTIVGTGAAFTGGSLTVYGVK